MAKSATPADLQIKPRDLHIDREALGVAGAILRREACVGAVAARPGAVHLRHDAEAVASAVSVGQTGRPRAARHLRGAVVVVVGVTARRAAAITVDAGVDRLGLTHRVTHRRRGPCLDAIDRARVEVVTVEDAS